MEPLREQPNVVPASTASGDENGVPSKSECYRGLGGLSGIVCMDCSTDEI